MIPIHSLTDEKTARSRPSGSYQQLFANHARSSQPGTRSAGNRSHAGSTALFSASFEARRSKQASGGHRRSGAKAIAEACLSRQHDRGRRTERVETAYLQSRGQNSRQNQSCVEPNRTIGSLQRRCLIRSHSQWSGMDSQLILGLATINSRCTPSAWEFLRRAIRLRILTAWL